MSFFRNPPHSLKNLEICLWFTANQQSEEVLAFFEALNSLARIISLKLAFHPPFVRNQPPFLDSLYSSLFTSLQSLSQLETLQLRFPYFPCIENKHIQHLASTLQCLKNLKRLLINPPFLQSPNEGLISLGQSLQHLTNFSTLDLDIANSFSHQSMQIFSHSIAHLNPTNLTLDFNIFAGSVPRPTSTIKRIFRKLVNLWKKNSLSPFFSDLQNFTLLSTLTLHLSSLDISAQDLKSLCLASQKFQNLSFLHLNLPQFHSAKNLKRLQKLLSCLKDLPKLNRLDLCLHGEREIGILFPHLASFLSLRTLSLSFTNAAPLKNGSLYLLLLGIRSLLKLKSLYLFFERQNPGQATFGEKAVFDFLQGLAGLKELTEFYFLYKKYSMYTHTRSLLPPNLESIKNLRNLTYFLVDNFRYI